jgi:MFS family permease
MPSIIALSYPDQAGEYIGYLNTAIGIGLCLGPTLSSFLFHFCGYGGTFFIFAGMILTLGNAGICLVPSSVN